MAVRATPNSARSTRLGSGPDPIRGPMIMEETGLVKKSNVVVLDGSGNGTLFFFPYNAHQRWEIDQVVVRTNQGATTTPVPVARVYVNDSSSAGNLEGETSSGNQDTLIGHIEVGPVDQLIVTWTGGRSGDQATAVITGRYYTRRR